VFTHTFSSLFNVDLAAMKFGGAQLGSKLVCQLFKMTAAERRKAENRIKNFSTLILNFF
jgi:hypothetical protein